MLESVVAFFSESALWLLFSTGFLSATLLPGGSEATLISILGLDQYSAILIIIVATLGNTLGGLTCYWFGRYLPSRTRKNQKALTWLSTYGYTALLFSWVPVIGDPLCVAAGWLRMRLLPALICIAIGKAVRYSLLAALFLEFL